MSHVTAEVCGANNGIIEESLGRARIFIAFSRYNVHQTVH